MSFILDALKKSELERQRQSVPGLIDAGTPPRRARFPGWAIALAALLAVNLAALLFVLVRGGLTGVPVRPADSARLAASGGASAAAPGAVSTPPAPSRPNDVPSSPATAAAPAAAASESALPEQHFSPMDAAPPVYAPEIPADSGPTSGTMPGAAERATHSTPASSSARGQEHDPLLTGGDKSDQEALPTINELNLTGANALPDLHLDVHVYATKPAERFVYINMHRYREGDALAEGPVVERIRRDGVVLDYRGLRFLLPRQ